LLATKRIDISDDSSLARLGITYGVLRRLGYSEETVERCLAATDGTDLEEAHEWVRGFYRIYGTRMSRSFEQLFLHCTDDELQPHSRKLSRFKSDVVPD
jgi:hypothetical protein